MSPLISGKVALNLNQITCTWPQPMAGATRWMQRQQPQAGNVKCGTAEQGWSTPFAHPCSWCEKPTYLSGVERYFCFWNFFSSPMSWISVKMVLLRRGFFERGGGCSASDSLLPWGSPGDPCVPGPGQGWAGSREPPAAGSSCGSTGGCRAMTDSTGYARTEGEPATEEAEGDEGQFSADVFE